MLNCLKTTTFSRITIRNKHYAIVSSLLNPAGIELYVSRSSNLEGNANFS